MTRRTMPYHRRYHGDALQGYMPLTLEERGAYTTILDLIYDQGGPIVRNERYLAGMMNCSIRLARSLIDALIGHQKLYVTRDSKLSNHRAEREIEAAIAISAKRAESGAKKGANSGNTGKFASNFNDSTKQLQNISKSRATRLPVGAAGFPHNAQPLPRDDSAAEKTRRNQREVEAKRGHDAHEFSELLIENNAAGEQLQSDCAVIPEPDIDNIDLYPEPTRENERIQEDLSYLAKALNNKLSGRTPHPPSPAGRIPGARD